MNRLIFEDDDVIQQALMMDSDYNDDSSLNDTRPIPSKENLKENKAKPKEIKNILKKTPDKEFTNKETEKDQGTETKNQCQNCLQEFKKEDLQNHDCAKKKRKSLVLSFHINKSMTSSPNAKNIRKGDIKNDAAKSDKRQAADSSTSKEIGKDNYKQSSKLNKNISDLDENERNVEVKKSKTPIFYECSVCFQHFTRKEIENHKCRDDSPCLTLRFSMSSSFNDSVANTSKRAKKSVSFKEFPKKYIKTVDREEKAEVKHKKDSITSSSTESKQPITSQHYENGLKNDSQTAIKNKIPMKRKYLDSEKITEKQINELKTKNRKVDKQNNEINQSIDTTFKGSVRNGNAIDAIKTQSKKSTTKNTDQPNEHRHIEKSCTVILHKIDIDLKQNVFNKQIIESPKQILIKSQSDEKKRVENSDNLQKDDKILSQSIDKISKKDAKSSENVKIRFNEVDLLEKEKDGTLCQNLVNKETEAIQLQNKQDDSNSNKQDSGTKNKISNNQNEKATDKFSQGNKTFTRNDKKKVNSETYKLFRLNELKILLEKEGKNHLNLKAEEVTTQKRQDHNTVNENSKNQKETKQLQSKKRKIVKNCNKLLKQDEISQNTDIISRRDEKSSKNVISAKYKLFRLNEHKILLEKEKEGACGHDLGTKKTEIDALQNKQDGGTVNVNSNLIEEATNIKTKGEEKLSENINRKGVSENYKLFRLNELKVLLEKEREVRRNRDLQNKEPELVTTRNEQDHSTENEYSNNQQEKEDNRNFESVEADLPLNKKNNENAQEKLIKIERNQVDNTEKKTAKKNKHPSLQKKYKCRICCAIYTKIKHRKHICKKIVKKTKSKKNQRQIFKKPNALFKNLKNNSQRKVNITILSRESVKVITVSNNAKDYEVNQGDISNYVHVDQISKQDEIKETPEQTLTKVISVNKSSVKTTPQSEQSNISEEKVTLNVPGRTEPLTEHKNSERQNANRPTNEDLIKTVVEKSFNNEESVESDITSKEFRISEEKFKTQENITTLSKEPQTQNEKDDEKQTNSTETENTILSQNSDHSYSTTNLESNLSMNTVNSEYTVTPQDVEHNYSVSEENFTSNNKIRDMKTNTTENDTILTENKRNINENELKTNKNEENETITTDNKTTRTKNKEKLITTTGNQTTGSKNQIGITSTKNKLTASKYELTTTKYDENKFLEATKIENILKNDPRSDDQQNTGHEDNASAISMERIRSIEIIDVFVCTRCSQEFSENDIRNHVCCKNIEINQLGKVSQIENPKHSGVKEVIASMDDVESDITVSEVAIPQSQIADSESKITVNECEILFPENVESVVTISESVESTISHSEIMIPKSVITVPEIVESEITVTTQNENTTPTLDIENFTNQIASIEHEMVISNVANEVIITTQTEGLDNIVNSMIEDNSVSIDNVAQEVIIPAVEEEITYEESKVVSADLTNQENYSFVLIENVEHEAIVAIQNIETDVLSIENVENEIVTLNERVVTQNVDNEVESTKNEQAISNKDVGNSMPDENLENLIIITTQNEGVDNIASTQNTENKEHQIEKVSVESLENECFVLKYDETNDSIEDVQIKTNVSSKYGEASASIEELQINETNISKQDETSISTLTNNIEIRDLVEDVQDETNVSTEYIRPSDLINETNIPTQNDNLSGNNKGNTVENVTETDQNQPAIDKNNGNNVCVQNEVTTSTKEQLPSQSKEVEKITPTNDEIETIIIISSEDENKKNIILTQNEKNETVIIISKQKEEISADYNTAPNTVEEITVKNTQNEHIVGNQCNKLSLTEKVDIETKNKRKCSKCLKIFIEDELKTHNCTEKGKDKIKESGNTKFKLKNSKKLPKHDDDIGEKEKENNTLYTETQLAAILNQNDSQDKILETQEHSSNPPESSKCEENKKEDNTLETQLAAILNQNETQNKMADKQQYSGLSSANNIRKDIENKESPLTNNQLLNILSKNEEDISQIENSKIINTEENNTKTKCFRCSKEYTDKELTTHNCLENDEKTTSNLETYQTSAASKTYIEKSQDSDKIEKHETEVSKSKQNNVTVENNIVYVIETVENLKTDENLKTKCIRCFTCSEIYDKTHICSNIEKETDKKNISLKKPDANTQKESKPTDKISKKKNKYYFDAYIIKENGIFKCKICKKQYNARKNLVRHMHQHEKGYDKERFKCSLCPKTFQYKNSLKLHEACHTGETFSCDICDQSFSRKTNLYTHLKLHNSDEKFYCNECKKEYTSKKCFNNHPCFNTKIYPCEFCDKKYKQKYNLIDHLHTHVGLKPYECEFCNEKFESRFKYSKHTENCTVAKQQNEIKNKNKETTVKYNKNGQFTCKICSKVLKNKSQLQKHEWRHENKNFLCNICPKTFTSKHYLQLHLTSHVELGIKRDKFECPECDKEFSTKFGLKLHFNKHTGVKFPCPLCEKLFTTKLLLKTHERTHTGQNPFLCENCNRAFNNRSNFNRHVKNKICFMLPMELDVNSGDESTD